MPATKHVGPWIIHIRWEDVETTNQAICAGAHAQVGRTSEGYAPAKELWEGARAAGDMAFADVLELARKCHRLAPFLNYNGNTFTAIVRPMCDRLPLGGMQKASIRQFAGHMVAGVLDYQAEAAFLAALEAGRSMPPPSNVSMLPPDRGRGQRTPIK